MAGATAAKSKKLQRKQETENLQRVRALVKEAAEAQDLMEAFPAFRCFDRHGLRAQLAFLHAGELPAATLDWAFALCKHNMQVLYEATWGWKDREKRAELRHEGARYFIASELPASSSAEGAAPDGPSDSTANAAAEAPGAPVAFLHFRFEEEAGSPVLYVYDVQLEARCHRKGLGRLLMSLAELAAARARMAAVMLTVMQANSAALELYRRLGYREHPSSPPPASEAGYLILHKPLPPRQ